MVHKTLHMKIKIKPKRMSLNIGDQHECYGRINSFYFTCGTRRVEHIKNLVISHIQIGDKWWTRRNEKNVTTTNNQCSSLNADLFRINITKYPKCQCGAPFKDSIHNLMECPLYQNERDCIFRNLKRNPKKYRNITLWKRWNKYEWKFYDLQ
jgi:hypothetical protein